MAESCEACGISDFEVGVFYCHECDRMLCNFCHGPCPWEGDEEEFWEEADANPG